MLKQHCYFPCCCFYLLEHVRSSSAEKSDDKIVIAVDECCRIRARVLHRTLLDLLIPVKVLQPLNAQLVHHEACNPVTPY